jgi:HEAT repeat protein
MSGTTANSDVLIGQLKSAPDWQDRRISALRLARCPGPGVFEALAASLSDRDSDVRRAAIQALEELGDPRAVELLTRPMVLDDPSPEIRWAAVKALGRLGSLSITTALLKPLDDEEWVVRNQALLVMSDFIRNLHETLGGEQVKSLIRLLPIADEEVHALVVDALARRSTLGFQEIREALRSQSQVVRAGVAEALGQGHDPRAVAPLMEALRDPSGAVRKAAAAGLGRLKDSACVEALIVALGDRDAGVSKAAMSALVSIGRPAVGPLCSALQQSLPKTHRRYVVLALGGIRDTRAILPLLNSLSSTYYVVRQAAITALSSYGEDAVEGLMSMVETSAIPLDPLLREVEEQKNKRLRLRAIRALGEIKDAAAIKPLRKISKDRLPDIADTTQAALSKIGLAAWGRYGAVVALGNIGSRKALPALIRALADYWEHVRREAARALAAVPDPSAVPHLIKALEKDEDSTVRRQAGATLRVMGEQKPDVAKAFRKALMDPSWEVRVEAARALGRIDDEESVAALIEALEDPSYTVLTSAEHALANLRPLSLPRLLEIAGGPPSPGLEPALRTLQEIFGDASRAEIDAIGKLPQAERRARLERLAR